MSNTVAKTSPADGLQQRWTVAKFQELAIEWLLFGCACVSVLTTLGILWVLFSEAVLFFTEVSPWEFLTDTRWTPQFADKHFGILPLLCGTLLVAVIAALIGLPTGLLAAVYLSEYASQRSRAILKPILEVLAGIPSIVYGYFALIFVTPYVLKPLLSGLLGIRVDQYNVASAGIVVGIMIIPTICSLSEDVLRSVPRGLREAGLALGATRFDVTVRIILPAALSGIIAAFLLAMSRAVGETMAVTIAAGNKPQLSLNIFRTIETMTAYIVNVSLGDTPAGSIEYRSLYAVAVSLFLITLAMNLLAQMILRKYRNVYQ